MTWQAIQTWGEEGTPRLDVRDLKVHSSYRTTRFNRMKDGVRRRITPGTTRVTTQESVENLLREPATGPSFKVMIWQQHSTCEWCQLGQSRTIKGSRGRPIFCGGSCSSPRTSLSEADGPGESTGQESDEIWISKSHVGLLEVH